MANWIEDGAGQGTVRMRLLCSDDRPPSPDGSEVVFGLQDTKGGIVPGVRDTAGLLHFDFVLTVKRGPDDRPNFGGPFASGPRDERFVYLSWKRTSGEGYVNRVKARLKDLDWPLLQAAQAAGCPLVADMTGRKPGGGNVPVDWRIAVD